MLASLPAACIGRDNKRTLVPLHDDNKDYYWDNVLVAVLKSAAPWCDNVAVVASAKLDLGSFHIT